MRTEPARIRAARALIAEHGFVVVPFKTPKPRGFRTQNLWGERVDHVFAVVGEATVEEWRRQFPVMESMEAGASSGMGDPAAIGYPHFYKLATD